nr:P1 family peptidase [Coprococcus sp. AF21-14LB]
MMNGSGDIALAFTTANRIPHTCSEGILPMRMLHDDQMDILFRHPPK